MKIGIIDVGGGLRGIYAAGILDYCLDHKINFDLGIGVSAGAANLASFVAQQPKRNYTFYKEYSQRPEYMSLHNFIHNGSYVDLDYVYDTLSQSDGEYPVDFETFKNNSMDLMVVATNAFTGNPAYFKKEMIKPDEYDAFKASCAIPFICKPYKVANMHYFDGALSDPIPVDKAFEWGCDKVIVVLTRPANYIRDPKKDILLSKFIQPEYANASEKLKNRANLYNETLERCKRLQAEGKVLLIAPDNTCGMDTLTKDTAPMDEFYQMGYKDGEKIELFINANKEEPKLLIARLSNRLKR